MFPLEGALDTVSAHSTSGDLPPPLAAGHTGKQEAEAGTQPPVYPHQPDTKQDSV